MKGSFFGRLALVALFLAAFAKGNRNVCGSGKEGKAVARSRYMIFDMAEFNSPTASMDWKSCREECKQKNKCRAWQFKSSSRRRRCILYRKGYEWVTYTGQSYSYAGRCWPEKPPPPPPRPYVPIIV